MIFYLCSLQVLHLHNNQLSSLPDEVMSMKNLAVIVLAFNHFTAIPSVLLQSQHANFQVKG
jgi:Leucine-rich repeat (LRR) protein